MGAGVTGWETDCATGSAAFGCSIAGWAGFLIKKDNNFSNINTP